MKATWKFEILVFFSLKVNKYYLFYFFNWLFHEGNRIFGAKKWWELIGLWKESFAYTNVNLDKK